jgi:hypothetical protein
MFLGSIEKRAANRNAVVNVNSNLMVSANNILLFLKKYQVNFGDLDIDEKLIVVKTDKINSPTPLTTTSAFNGVPLQVLDL